MEQAVRYLTGQLKTAANNPVKKAGIGARLSRKLLMLFGLTGKPVSPCFSALPRPYELLTVRSGLLPCSLTQSCAS